MDKLEKRVRRMYMTLGVILVICLVVVVDWEKPLNYFLLLLLEKPLNIILLSAAVSVILLGVFFYMLAKMISILKEISTKIDQLTTFLLLNRK